MRSFSSRLIPVAIASILCGVAVAGGGKGDADTTSMDPNDDGKITTAEYERGEQQIFARMDADGDSFVTAPELDGFQQSMMKGHKPSSAGKQGSSQDKIAKLDTDNDGKVSASEWDAAARLRFRMIDQNGDGTLTVQEVRESDRATMANDE